jgi:4-amino-4-deoxy-L-arabinose transferase-like glycosyltransferase
LTTPLLKVWLFVAAAALAVQLGSVPLIDADEGRNAEVAREMAATNDYVMPRLNSLPYLDKPIVYFAAEAAVMEVLGPTELAARLPAYLFTLATAAIVFWFARRIGADPYVASIAFLSMPLTIAFARTVIFDSALTFFVTVALAAFYVAIEEQQKQWSILAWAAMGVAMITKGPVTFILVLIPVVIFAWRAKAVRVVFPLLGIIAFVAVTAPWVWGVMQVVPEFLRYVLVTETAERMATKALKRTGPPWYFVPYLIGGALPWSIAALFSWKELKQRDRAMLYLLLWLAVPFVFFSLSQSKRPQYILPLMVPIALAIGRIWERLRTRAAAIVLVAFGVIFAIAPFILHRTKLKPEIASVADETAIALAVAFLLGGIGALLVKRRELAIVALTIPMLAFPAASTPLLRGIAERRSAKSFVEEMRPHLTPQTRIVGIEAYTGSMQFYLERPITLVTEDASELTSNYLMRRYDQFTRAPGSPLVPEQRFEVIADPNVIYVVRNNDAARRALFASRGLRQIADGAHHVAYK